MPLTDQQTTAVNELTAEAQAIEAIAKKIYADYKAGGLKNLTQDIPVLVKEVPSAIAVIKRDVPIIKSGKTTTEFVLVLVVIVAQITLEALGHPLPVAEAVAIDSLTAIYTLARSFVKSSATTVTTTPAVAATTTTTTTNTPP